MESEINKIQDSLHSGDSDESRSAVEDLLVKQAIFEIQMDEIEQNSEEIKDRAGDLTENKSVQKRFDALDNLLSLTNEIVKYRREYLRERLEFFKAVETFQKITGSITNLDSSYELAVGCNSTMFWNLLSEAIAEGSTNSAKKSL